MTDRNTRVAELIAELEQLDCKVNIKTGKEKAEDKTVGAVGKKVEEEVNQNIGLVVEKADTGRGFAMYRDVSRGDVEVNGKKLLRLSRG